MFEIGLFVVVCIIVAYTLIHVKYWVDENRLENRLRTHYGLKPERLFTHLSDKRYELTFSLLVHDCMIENQVPIDRAIQIIVDALRNQEGD